MARQQSKGELELIAAIRSVAGHPRGPVRLGIGDDCAILRPPPGQELLVTTDFSIEGRHFRRDWHPARSVGHRCLARGLSDIAAMGGKPAAAFLSLALPTTLRASDAGRKWVQGFLDGLLALAQATGTQLSGGDTAAAPGDDILADIVCLGFAPAGKALRRSTARPGDALYVTGTLGGASAELAQLGVNPRRFQPATPQDAGGHPHLFPAPRILVGQALLRRGLAAAAIDLSDGLSTDLAHICEESKTGAVIDADVLPIAPIAHRPDLQDAFALALHGGEDYELLFCARPTAKMPKQLAGVALTRIGEVTQEPGMRLRQHGRETPLEAHGWEHAL